MKNTLLEKEIYSDEIALSLKFIFERHNAILKKYGVNNFFNKSVFKKAREIWITSTFLLGLSKDTGREYWVLPEYKDQTPDTYGMSVVDHFDPKFGKIKEIINFEITEWESHNELLELIDKKLIKQYPNFFILLIYGRRNPGEAVDMERIFQDLKTREIVFSEIWFLGSALGKAEDNHTIVRLFPERAEINFSLKNEILKNNQKEDMVKFFRGKGEASIIEENFYLPLPNIDF